MNDTTDNNQPASAANETASDLEQWTEWINQQPDSLLAKQESEALDAPRLQAENATLRRQLADAQAEAGRLKAFAQKMTTINFPAANYANDEIQWSAAVKTLSEIRDQAAAALAPASKDGQA